jgi:hypothetical protein
MGTRQQDTVQIEAQFVAKINELRQSRGLNPLQVDGELTDQARAWAETMRQAGHIYHASDLSVGITSDWQKLGENVGVGGEVAALFDAFVASPKHFENLVDPAYTYVGVGVVWDGSRMYTTHRFMAVFPPAPSTTQPPAVPRTTPTTAPPRVSPSAEPPEELASIETTTTTAAPVAPVTTTTAPPPPPIPANEGRVTAVLKLLERHLQ